jgi:glycyl-tRNA synthetase
VYGYEHDIELREHFAVQYDQAGSIGRRYRRQDEIGTPFCITVDYESLDDRAVTVRHRDTMTQDRVPIADLSDWLFARVHA